MGETTIAYADYSFQGWMGCKKVSPGCDNCFAERAAVKFGVGWGDASLRREMSEENWRKPHRWDRAAALAGERRRVLAFTMGDIMDESAPSAARLRLWETIRDTPHLIWMLLTKRPENFARFLPVEISLLPNVWLGVSVEDQERAQERIPLLLQTPAMLHWVSAEPLLDRLDLSPWIKRLDWVVVGGESGHRARVCYEEDILNVKWTCHFASVPCFVKQMGARSFFGREGFGRYRVKYRHRAGGDPQEWPEWFRVREFPERGGK